MNKEKVRWKTGNVVQWNFWSNKPWVFKTLKTSIITKVSSYINRCLEIPSSFIYKLVNKTVFKVSQLLRTLDVKEIVRDTSAYTEFCSSFLTRRTQLVSSPSYSSEKYSQFLWDLKLWDSTNFEKEFVSLRYKLQKTSSYSQDERTLFLNLILVSADFKRKLKEIQSWIEWLRKNIDSLIEIFEFAPQLQTSYSDVIKLKYLLEYCLKKNLSELKQIDLDSLNKLARRIKY